MAKFAILRVQKLKSRVSLVRSLKHSYRDQETPNADENLTPNNEHLESSNLKEAIDKYKARLPDKVRKNAVHCIEYLITASPEAMQRMTKDEQDEYFKNSLEWLRDKHGAENVISAGVHRDETTPHMYAYVVPIDERGKLNCRAFLGEFDALSKMQTDFYNKVASKCDLERGIEGSKAKHTRIKDFYKNLTGEEIQKLNKADSTNTKVNLFYEKLIPRVIRYERKANNLFMKEPVYESYLNLAERITKEHLRPIQDNYFKQRLENDKLHNQFSTYKNTHKVNTYGLSHSAIEALKESAEYARNLEKTAEQERKKQLELEREKNNALKKSHSNHKKNGISR